MHADGAMEASVQTDNRILINLLCALFALQNPSQSVCKSTNKYYSMQKILSVNNFVKLQRKGVRPVVNFVHGS